MNFVIECRYIRLCPENDARKDWFPVADSDLLEMDHGEFLRYFGTMEATELNNPNGRIREYRLLYKGN